MYKVESSTTKDVWCMYKVESSTTTYNTCIKPRLPLESKYNTWTKCMTPWQIKYYAHTNGKSLFSVAGIMEKICLFLLLEMRRAYGVFMPWKNVLFLSSLKIW